MINVTYKIRIKDQWSKKIAPAPWCDIRQEMNKDDQCAAVFEIARPFIDARQIPVGPVIEIRNGSVIKWQRAARAKLPSVHSRTITDLIQAYVDQDAIECFDIALRNRLQIPNSLPHGTSAAFAVMVSHNFELLDLQIDGYLDELVNAIWNRIALHESGKETKL